MYRILGPNSRSLAGLVLSLVVLWLPPALAARPNLVFIYTDDQGPWTIGANGYADAHTPNLDKLFGESANLVNAMVNTPVCSPSRASLLTSRYGSELMITEWIHRKRSGLDPNLPTWPRQLQKHGYRTALIGKWHLGYPDRCHPAKFGYDYFMGMRAGGIAPKNPKLEKDGKVQQFNGLTDDLFTDEAIAFVDRNRDRPFALSLHFRAPHTAWLPVAPADLAPHADTDFSVPHPDVPQLNVAKLKQDLHDYAASVTCVDRNVGRLLDRLDTLNLRDNTIVVFTSDHGYHVGQHGLWSKGNSQHRYHPPPKNPWPAIPAVQRPNLFDAALRVPTAVRWPGRIPAGTRTQVVNNMDWFPTLLALVDVPLPEKAVIRGRDASSILRGETPDWDNDHYAEYDMRIGAQAHMRAIRTTEWKLMIDFLSPGRIELYDLSADPDERRNLYPPTNERTTTAFTRLQRQLLAKIASVNNHQQDAPYGITINFGGTILGAVAPGKSVGLNPIPFVNNVTKPFRNADRAPDAPVRDQLVDSRGLPTSARLLTPPGKFAIGNNPFRDWDEVFMQEAAEFSKPIVVADLPPRLTTDGYRLLLYANTPLSGKAVVNGNAHQIRTTGGFDGTYSTAKNVVTIPDLTGKRLSLKLPPNAKLAGLQLIAN